MPRIVQLQGQQFGRLLVIERGTAKSGNMRWRCRCDCGKEALVLGTHLRHGNTRSCGCFRDEVKRRPKSKYACSWPPGQAAMADFMRDYLAGAKSRELLWDLTKEQFAALAVSNCHYCGTEPNRHMRPSRNGGVIVNGIDRLDCREGYTPANCVSCCSICNRAKYTMSEQDFEAWIHRASNHMKTKR